MTDTQNTVKVAIQNASSHAQSTIAKTETAATAAVERVEDAMSSVKAGFETVKAFGGELVGVVDNVGRTVLGGAVAVNGSLVNYGRDVVNDTIEVGRKTFEAKSVTDVVNLHTAFAERRISAYFQTIGAINSLAQSNVMAMWSPFASMVRGAGSKAEGVKFDKPTFKSVA